VLTLVHDGIKSLPDKKKRTLGSLLIALSKRPTLRGEETCTACRGRPLACPCVRSNAMLPAPILFVASTELMHA
jgi:hypothetical protein